MTKANVEETAKVAHMIEWTSQRIKEIRENRGWTQQKLSNEMQVASTRIGDFENGRFEIKCSTLFRIMRSLGVSPTEFFRSCPGWDAPKKRKST